MEDKVFLPFPQPTCACWVSCDSLNLKGGGGGRRCLTRKTLVLYAKACSPCVMCGWLAPFHPHQEIRRWPVAPSQDSQGSNCSSQLGEATTPLAS